MKAVQELHREYGWRVRDSSRIYSNYKDLNDYLTGKKLSQSLEFPQPTKQTERQVQQPTKKKGKGFSKWFIYCLTVSSIPIWI